MGLGGKEFQTGLTFVALSRVKTLDDILLVEPLDYSRVQKLGRISLQERLEDFARRQAMFLLGRSWARSHVGARFDTTQVDITEDQTSPDQLREEFQEGAANNKVCLEELSFGPFWQSHWHWLRCITHPRATAVCDGAGFSPSTHTCW